MLSTKNDESEEKNSRAARLTSEYIHEDKPDTPDTREESYRKRTQHTPTDKVLKKSNYLDKAMNDPSNKHITKSNDISKQKVSVQKSNHSEQEVLKPLRHAVSVPEGAQKVEEESVQNGTGAMAGAKVFEHSANMEPRSSQLLTIECKPDESSHLDVHTARALSMRQEVQEAIKDVVIPDTAVYYRSATPYKGQLEGRHYFHGLMDREDAEKLLQVKPKGSFLIRKVAVQDYECFVISVQCMWGVTHHRVFSTESAHWFWLSNHLFTNICDLIDFHIRKKEPLDKGGTLITKGIKRAPWQLTHEQVTMGKKLGEGAFGEVFSGHLLPTTISLPIKCAAKTMHTKGSTQNDKAEFLHEARVMLSLRHPNVIRLYGVAALKDPIIIVMQLALGGNLLHRLREKPCISTKTKLKYTDQILSGMAYLQKMEIIHRDLATRNVLLDGQTCKISDFGLSVKGVIHKQARLCKVPVRWLAPETLTQGLFSSKTDVWSFGVTIWEVFSNGSAPYGSVPELKLVRLGVVSGKLHLDPIEGLRPFVKDLIDDCLLKDFNKRPSFSQLSETLNTRSGTYQKVQVSQILPVSEKLPRSTFIRRIFSKQSGKPSQRA